MHVAHLALEDFRSYRHAELDLESGATLLVGRNGQGKTNLVEAIGYAASQTSHRVAADAPLVRDGASRAIIRAGLVSAGRELLVEIEINPGRSNRARLNRAPVSRPREALGALRCVLFAPEDLALVKGDPGERRRYLDETLVARAPRFAGVRADYERVLKQRNALLKSLAGRRGGHGSGRGVPQTLEVWDTHLARAGAELVVARRELVEELRPLVAASYAELTDLPVPDGATGPLEMAYRPSFEAAEELFADSDRVADALLEALAQARPNELERGVTLVGPHRDEVALRLGGLPTRGYASQGESWSLALALRLASFELLRAGGDDPVLLLDDVFAELDGRRRARLAKRVAAAEQTVITAAVPADVPDELSGFRFDVADGEVRRAG